MRDITVYTTPNCPFCKDVKQFLDDQGIRYEEVDVAGSAEARDVLKQKSGGLSVPVVDIDSTIIVGFDVQKIEAALDRDQAH